MSIQPANPNGMSAESTPTGVYTSRAAALSTETLFSEAQKLHRAQRFAEAEGLYRRIVEVEPKHVGGWHLLGLVSTALEKWVEAVEAFERALALSPDHVETLTQLGIVLARQQHLPEAIARFRRALELRPDHAKANNNLGVALTQSGRRDEALACYREAARLQPDYAEAHFNLGIALADIHKIDEALAAYHRALQVRPDYPDALSNLGMLLIEERRPGEAIVFLEQAVRLQPDNPVGYNNLCLAYADHGRFADAVASSDVGLRLRPLEAKAHMNRGNALASLGRIDESIASYDLAILLQPDYVSAHWNRSLARLSRGDFERGWPEYEWRWKRAETKARHFPEPPWDGSSLEGKTVLLWCEQGLGDMIQFARYAALVKRLGASGVWLECPANLLPLLSTCPGVDRVLEEGTPLPSGFDCQAPLMTLPQLCGTTLANVPAETPYLRADAGQVEHWRMKLGRSRHFKIGIVWQGNPKHRFDQFRSIPLQWFRMLATLEGVELYSLQKGAGAKQLQTARFPIIDLQRQLDKRGGTLNETAAAMQALDLIVTCDSAPAHLAGALGLPVWVAMTTPADWRWLLDREDTPWYPTMRLFRQEKLGEWGPVFERIREAIGARRHAAAPVQHELAPYFNLLSSFNNANQVAVDLAHNVFLVGAVLARKPTNVLELGVGSGYVTNSLLHALRYNGQGRLTSVDNWFDWKGAEPPFVSSLRAAGANLVVSGEEEFVRAAPDSAYDLLVSDADHFRSAGWLDQHLRIVQNDGFLFFHDTNQPQVFPGLATIEKLIRERGLPYYHFKESSRPDERCQRGWLFVISKK